jgi:Predicted acetyltransferase
MSDNEISNTKPYILRDHQPGDMGWIASRHGAIYAQEYNWNGRIESYVCKACADFIEKYDPSTEHCWIAERDGRPVGSIALINDRESEGTAKLRFLFVEKEARGLGIGRRLIQECIRFAREKGYKRIDLWTQSILIGARRLYKDAGFVLVKEEEHLDFGPRLIGELWQLVISDGE